MQHVVFALTPDEMGLFFATEPNLERAGVRHTWLSHVGMPREEWTSAIIDLQPTVMVSGWGCPRLEPIWKAVPGLRYVCNVTGSVKPQVSRAMIEQGVLVSNWGALASPQVAEHAFLLILASLRNLQGAAAEMEKPRSVFAKLPALRNRTLFRKRVGLHGFGAVARELVAMLKPFHTEIATYSQGVPEEYIRSFGVIPCASMEELAARSEVFVEVEGLTPTSRGSVTRAVLEQLPHDATFVNVGRGLVVDEPALADLANAGRIRLALDVYAVEPLPHDSPLRGNSSVILSPHVAGPVWETYPHCGALALENVEKFLAGKTPGQLVTLEVYDRST